MSSVLGQLQVLIGANTSKFHTSMTGVEKRLASTGTKSLSAGKITASGLLMIGGAALTAGLQMEKATATIRAQTSATGDALKSMSDDVRALWGNVYEGPEKIAQALAQVNSRLDINGAQLRRHTSLYLDLAHLQETEVIPIIDKTTRLFGDWGIAVEEQEDRLNQLYRASNMSGVKLEFLAEQVVNFGAPLRNLGYSLDDAITLFAKWEKEGVNVQTVMSGMRMAVAYFGKEGINAASGIQDLIETIKTSSEEQGKLAAKTVVGQRAFNDFYDAVKGGKFDFDEFTKKIKEGTDTIAAAGAQSRTTGERFGKLFQKALKKAEPLGERILPLLENLVRFGGELINLANGIAGFFDEIGKSWDSLPEELKRPIESPFKALSFIGEWTGVAFGGETEAMQRKRLARIYAESEEEMAAMKARGPRTSEDHKGWFDKVFSASRKAKAEAAKVGKELGNIVKKASEWEKVQNDIADQLDGQKGAYQDILSETILLTDQLEKTMGSGISRDNAALIFLDDIIAKAEQFKSMGKSVPAEFAGWVEIANRLLPLRDNMQEVLTLTTDLKTESVQLENDYKNFGDALANAYKNGDISAEEYERRQEKLSEWYQTQKRDITARDKALLDGLAGAERKEKQREERLNREAETRRRLIQLTREFISQNATGLDLMAYIWEEELNPEIEKAQELFDKGTISIDTFANGIENSVTRALRVARGEFRSLDDFVGAIARQQGMTMEAVWT